MIAIQCLKIVLVEEEEMSAIANFGCKIHRKSTPKDHIGKVWVGEVD
jgi:hypothetical protein